MCYPAPPLVAPSSSRGPAVNSPELKSIGIKGWSSAHLPPDVRPGTRETQFLHGLRCVRPRRQIDSHLEHSLPEGAHDSIPPRSDG